MLSMPRETGCWVLNLAKFTLEHPRHNIPSRKGAQLFVALSLYKNNLVPCLLKNRMLSPCSSKDRMLSPSSSWVYIRTIRSPMSLAGQDVQSIVTMTLNQNKCSSTGLDCNAGCPVLPHTESSSWKNPHTLPYFGQAETMLSPSTWTSYAILCNTFPDPGQLL